MAQVRRSGPDERPRMGNHGWKFARLHSDCDNCIRCRAQSIDPPSGGQKTKVFLAGISIHQPEIVLLDEPSNHLDKAGRQLLYDFIQTSSSTLIVVSHDRKLLNLLDLVYELSKRGITVYGGNYDFYAEQKLIETNALNQELKSTEKALRKAKEVARETAERQQKLDARGKKKKEKEAVPTISMNTLKNIAEKSTSRIKSVHAEKLGSISQELNQKNKKTIYAAGIGGYYRF